MLDWEEGLFRGGRALYARLWKDRKRKPFLEAAVSLAELRLELFYFAHLVAGRKIVLFETDEPVLRVGNRLCLPASCSLHADRQLNQSFYRVKVALAALSYRDAAEDSPGRSPEIPSELLRREYPALYEAYLRQEDALPVEGAWREHFSVVLSAREGDGAEGQEIEAPGDGEDESRFPDRDSTEIEGQGKTQVEVLLGKDIQAPDVPQHVFEKVETLEEFEGLDRQLDGTDDLKDHEEALKELDMRHVIRSKDRAAGIYRADMLMTPLELEVSGDPENKGIPYPEWDYRRREYRQDWAWVRVTEIVSEDTEWEAKAQVKYRARIHDLKRRLSQFSTDYLRAKAQPVGEEFDLEALVDARIRMRTGGAPSENIHVHRHRDLSDIATLILVDLSDSTDAWIKGEHVLETLRGALYCLGEVLDTLTHEFSIAGFASDTRRACRYFPIKEFNVPWGRAAKRLGGLSPQGYTRMGPVLRHASRILETHPASRKAVLLIGDGRPCDYDAYEGRYGIEDVKKAFREARDMGILTHAFAVDHRSREHFPAMFSPRHFDVISDPQNLAEAVFRFFLRLKTES